MVLGLIPEQGLHLLHLLYFVFPYGISKSCSRYHFIIDLFLVVSYLVSTDELYGLVIMCRYTCPILWRECF